VDLIHAIFCLQGERQFDAQLPRSANHQTGSHATNLRKPHPALAHLPRNFAA
jgi:hypothetical protein